METDDILSCFHHIHHLDDGSHRVDHCGGDHDGIDYEIHHCLCGRHSINKKEAIGHTTGMIEVRFEFTESCTDEGWHLESGKILS